MSTEQKTVKDELLDRRFVIKNSKQVLLDFSQKGFKRTHTHAPVCLLNSLRLASLGETLPRFSPAIASALLNYEKDVDDIFKKFQTLMDFLSLRFGDVDFKKLPKKETLNLIEPSLANMRARLKKTQQEAKGSEAKDVKKSLKQLAIIEELVLIYKSHPKGEGNIITQIRTFLFACCKRCASNFIENLGLDPIQECNKFLQKNAKELRDARKGKDMPKIITDYSEISNNLEVQFTIMAQVINELCLTQCFEHQPMNWNPSEPPTKLFNHLVEHGTAILIGGRYSMHFFKEKSLKKVDKIGPYDIYEWVKGSRKEKVDERSDAFNFIDRTHSILTIGFDLEKGSTEDPFVYYFDINSDIENALFRMLFSEFIVYMNSYNIYDYDKGNHHLAQGSPSSSLVYAYARRTPGLTLNPKQENTDGTDNINTLLLRFKAHLETQNVKPSPRILDSVQAEKLIIPMD